MKPSKADMKLANFGLFPLMRTHIQDLKKKCNHTWRFYKNTTERSHTEQCYICKKTKEVKT